MKKIIWVIVKKEESDETVWVPFCGYCGRPLADQIAKCQYCERELK